MLKKSEHQAHRSKSFSLIYYLHHKRSLGTVHISSLKTEKNNRLDFSHNKCRVGP